MGNWRDLTSIDVFKQFIDKKSSNTTNDDVIAGMILQSSIRIENYCRRKLRARTFTDYYDGDNTPNLFVNQYPIISVTSLYDDSERNWTSTDLKAATDYIIKSDEGIIALSPYAVKGTYFYCGIQNIKLTYYAGYDHFIIEEDTNDYLDYVEDGDDVSNTVAIQLTAGTYTGNELAALIATAMDAATIAGNTYTVTYNRNTGKFKIVTSGTSIQFLWDSGTNAYKAATSTLGFDETDDSPTSWQESDFGVLGIPNDLQMACNLLTLRLYNESGLGGDRFDIKKKVINSPGGGTGATNEFAYDNMPPEVVSILSKYKRTLL